MQPEDRETTRRDRLARAAEEATLATEHADAVLAALDDGLRELAPTPVPTDPRAFDAVTRELDATQRELEDARRALASAEESLRETGAPFQSLFAAADFVPPPPEALRLHREAQEAHARAKDRVEMLEGVLGELTQLRSSILTGQ